MKSKYKNRINHVFLLFLLLFIPLLLSYYFTNHLHSSVFFSSQSPSPSMSSSYESLKAAYEAAGQGHVFTFWDTLSAADQESLLAQLSAIDPTEISQIADSVIVNPAPVDESEAKLEPLPETATASLLDQEDEAAEWYKAGLDLIRKNSVAVILLAGGQGTRLGSSAPKGCYDVGLPSHKSLFQLQAERIAKVQELAGPGTVIPWYIMTSGPTRAPTEQFFKDNNYFGLDPANVVFFEQGVLPCLTKEGKIILETPAKVAVAPDGNGGIYKALWKSGVLADLKKRGIEHLHTYCVDNCLVKVADPVFLGWANAHKLDIGTKVVRKRDATESVGLIVSKNGRPGVIEYSEISPELAAEETEDGLLKLRAANIVNHYYSASFLEGIPSWPASALPYHIAHKKIPYVDIATGNVAPKPTSPNGIKLEQFVFDVFPTLEFDRFGSLEVHRSREFSPLKNAPGSKEDGPETSRADLLKESTRWLREAGANVAPGVEVEASPLTSYGGEGLDKFRGVEFSEPLAQI